jgi:2-polyprenyl-3-methyl-5-hydroxy-6-metoxy-1,4-benzoquinol methylase
LSTTAYTDFGWSGDGAGNGQSGVGLSQCFIKQIAELRNVKRICDLGCGNGYMTGRLAALGYQIVGVDGSETGVHLAQQKYPQATFINSYINQTIRELPGAGTFDLVISSDVIEHLYCPSDLFQAARSLLRPHGQLLLGTPYHGYIKNLALAVTGKLDSHFNVLRDGGHIKFFSVKTLSWLVRGHGFSDLTFSFYGRTPYLWKNMICHARKID